MKLLLVLGLAAITCAAKLEKAPAKRSAELHAAKRSADLQTNKRSAEIKTAKRDLHMSKRSTDDGKDRETRHLVLDYPSSIAGYPPDVNYDNINDLVQPHVNVPFPYADNNGNGILDGIDAARLASLYDLPVVQGLHRHGSYGYGDYDDDNENGVLDIYEPNIHVPYPYADINNNGDLDWEDAEYYSDRLGLPVIGEEGIGYEDYGPEYYGPSSSYGLLPGLGADLSRVHSPVEESFENPRLTGNNVQNIIGGPVINRFNNKRAAAAKAEKN